MLFQKTRRPYCFRQQGFTLIEVIIVSLIIAIMAAIAIPSFLSWRPKYHLKGAADDLYSTLQSARLLAVKQNKNIQVIFNTANTPGSYNISGRGPTALSSYKYGVDFKFPAGLNDWGGHAVASSITGFEAGPPPFCTFSSNGTANSGTIYLTNNDQKTVFAMTVLTSGAIKMRNYNGSSWN